MGFGKFLLGGVCAVGAVVAAPVVLPAAGFAIAAAPVTGLAGVSAGLAIAGTSATTAAAVAGAAGVVAGDMMERKHGEAVNEAYNQGCCDTSKEYELKFKKQEEFFQGRIDKLKRDAQKKNELIDIYEEYIKELEREKSERESRGENTVDLESALQKRRNELANIKSA